MPVMRPERHADVERQPLGAQLARCEPRDSGNGWDVLGYTCSSIGRFL